MVNRLASCQFGGTREIHRAAVENGAKHMADLLTIASSPNGDGMPIGNTLTPMIAKTQVTVAPGGVKEPAFDDNAAATIVWADFQRDSAWLEQKAWLAEWQYIDYIYQSPNFEGDWRVSLNGTARVSRFNVAKNSNTMSTQVRRGIFADQIPFLLEATGKLAGDADAQTYLDAATEILTVLDQRADFEYNFGLLIECMALQGTGIGVPRWDEKTVTKKSRKRNTPPVSIDMPVGAPAVVNTWESDDFKVVTEEVMESWPYFEFRDLGWTIWDEKTRTPNRPDLSASHRIDIDYVTLQDLQRMRELDCYKDIPEDDDLVRYFLANPYGDASPGTRTAQNSNIQNTTVLHAGGPETNASANPFEKPMMKLAYWTCERVVEMLVYEGRFKVIRNEAHELGDHALGYTANWWNIKSSLYGLGIGRINAGDQRMNQGVLNEVLKMIAYWTNCPLLYNTADGNAPTQNVVMGLGTMWGINAPPGTDVRKVLAYAEKPTIPAEAWKIMDMALRGGEDEVGANAGAMQGQISSTQGMARTAAGVNRSSSQSDAQVSDPIAHLEGIIVRWNRFKWQQVIDVMPIPEIRAILSRKFSQAIVDSIDPEKLTNIEFDIMVLAGQKLAAKAAIAQLIPFLLQLLQQPQLMEYMHQKGWTINFLAIEKIFLRVSELQGAEDIIVPLTDQEKQQVAQLNPNAQRVQAAALLEKLRGANKQQEIAAKGAQDQKQAVLESALSHVAGEVPLENEFALAEGRVDRNTDMQELQNGIPGVA
jgi:hypothetical protein